MQFSLSKNGSFSFSKFKTGFPYIFISSVYIADILFFWFRGTTMIDSDASSEMVLSSLLNKYGGIVTDKWYYSTELRVLNTQLVYRLALFLFPADWHLARTFSVAVFLLLLIFSGIYFVKAADLKSYGLLSVGILCCPLCDFYAINVVFNSYYIPHIVISLVSAGLILRIIRLYDTHRKIWFQSILLAVLCFGAGLGGVRQLMIFYVPLMIASLIILFIDVEKRSGTGALRQCLTTAVRENILIILSFASLLFSTAGYLVNNLVLSNIYHYRNYGGKLFGSLDLQNFINSLSCFLSLFGWKENAEVVSMKVLADFCACMLGFLVLAMTVLLLKRLTQLSFYNRFLILLFTSIFCLNGIILSTVPIDTSVVTPYWIPILPFAFFMLSSGCRYIREKKRLLGQCLFAGIMITVILCGLRYFRYPLLRGGSYTEPAEWLVDNGYSKGYATFWNSNILTELSNGKIETWTIMNDSNQVTETLHPYEWLQASAHDTETPDGKFFFVVSEEEYKNNCVPAFSGLLDHLYYQDGFLRIYGFDSMTEYKKLIDLQ
jgi:hypothetical protein